MRIAVDLVASTLAGHRKRQDSMLPGNAAKASSPDIDSVLAPISQRYLLYYPALCYVSGSAHAALMLSQMLYWTRKGRPGRDGWFWHTGRDWAAATGLSRYEQSSARNQLRQTGFVEEKLMGAPARMHFRVDLSELGLSIARHANERFTDWRWEHRATLALLGRPVVYLSAFSDLTGSVAASLYLSDLCQRQRQLDRESLNGSDRNIDVGSGWLDLPLGQSARHLGISEKRLRTAREILKRLGILSERSSCGIRPRTLSRLNLTRLANQIASKHRGSIPAGDSDRQARLEVVAQAVVLTGLAHSSNPELPKPANWNGAFEQSRHAETSKLDLPKAASLFAGFGMSVNEVSTPIGLLLQPPAQTSTDLEAGTGPSGSGFCTEEKTSDGPRAVGLKLPADLGASERESALRLLARLPDDATAQSVADEWSAQLRAGNVRVPLSYLAALVRRAMMGDFVPVAGIAEAQRRQHSLRVEQAVTMARASQPSSPPPVAAMTAASKPRPIPAFFRERLAQLGMAKNGRGSSESE